MREFMPYAPVGVVWLTYTHPLGTYNHALNFFLTDTYELYFLEPQTNEIYREPRLFGKHMEQIRLTHLHI